MKDQEIIEKVEIAVKKTFNKDAHLIENNLSEQSISHRIAVYLEELFPQYNIDCEYNGDIQRQNNRKSISLLKDALVAKGLIRENENEVEQEFINRAVFPDIIIHKRGKNENNLCILEVKKSTNTAKLGIDYDIMKLQSYTSNLYGNNLVYQIGLFLFIDIENFNYKLRKFKAGEEII